MQDSFKKNGLKIGYFFKSAQNVVTDAVTEHQHIRNSVICKHLCSLGRCYIWVCLNDKKLSKMSTITH